MQRLAVAYFSMEIALEPAMPTYAGGLGVLAGDTIRAAADLGVAMVGVSLLYRQGYFRQRLDATGWQHEEPVTWRIEDQLIEESSRAVVEIEDRGVQLRAWRYDVRGHDDHVVPVFFLDADLADNAVQDRELTGRLYGGDDRYRLCQEVLLGIGGVRMLRALGYGEIERFHMNEGHSALLTFELLDEQAAAAGRDRISHEDFDRVREMCVFTTHTPVPAGHDQFPIELVDRVIGARRERFPDFKDRLNLHLVARILQQDASHAERFRDLIRGDVRLNMTYLALNLSRYVNGVAKHHSEVSQLLFAGYAIDAITNGVHPATWVVDELAAVFDRHIPDWRKDNFSLRSALSIQGSQIWEAHVAAKQRLLTEVNARTAAGMDPTVLTIGFARRAAAYKRADLLVTDLQRLRSIGRRAGAFQVVYAGKAHPRDLDGKHLIQKIVSVIDALRGEIRMVYLEGYDLRLAKLMTGGVDLWLNTPQPPNEASGTSGMKAALNGIPSLSVLDGWWIEGHIEGLTGWAIDPDGGGSPGATATEAQSLYDKLESRVLPTYYSDRAGWIDMMRHAIALNGAYFNTQRMIQQYVAKAYF